MASKYIDLPLYLLNTVGVNETILLININSELEKCGFMQDGKNWIKKTERELLELCKVFNPYELKKTIDDLILDGVLISKSTDDNLNIKLYRLDFDEISNLEQEYLRGKL